MERAREKNVRGSYAGVWPRLLAFGWDYIIIVIYLILVAAIGFAASRVYPDIGSVLFSNPVSAQLTGFLLVTFPVTLYFALTESSKRWQGSWGKHRAGLAVIGRDGKIINRWRALFRNLLKFIPWELAHFTIWQFRLGPNPPSPLLDIYLILVWVLVGLNLLSLWISPSCQTLYDRLTRTWVVIRN
jgi:uncharacterized RDD family membrane protein YckC